MQRKAKYLLKKINFAMRYFFDGVWSKPKGVALQSPTAQTLDCAERPYKLASANYF